MRLTTKPVIKPYLVTALKTILAISVAYGLFSCRPKTLSASELQAYIRDPAHGLTKDFHVQNVDVSVSYHPADFLIKQELSASLAAGTGGRDSLLARLRHKYANHYYFTLSLSSNNAELLRQVGNQSSYYDLLQTLSFRMNEYVQLVSSRADTVSLANYTFDQTYGMASANTLLLAFDKNKVSQADWIQVNLTESGLGVGNLAFRFQQKDLSHTPSLVMAQGAGEQKTDP